MATLKDTLNELKYIKPRSKGTPPRAVEENKILVHTCKACDVRKDKNK
jgi:hypothetical protein